MGSWGHPGEQKEARPPVEQCGWVGLVGAGAQGCGGADTGTVRAQLGAGGGGAPGRRR